MATDTLAGENSHYFPSGSVVSASGVPGSMGDENSNPFQDLVKLCFDQNSRSIDEGMDDMYNSQIATHDVNSKDQMTDLVSILKESIEAADDMHIQLGYGHLNTWGHTPLHNEDSCSSAPYLKLFLHENTAWLQRLDPSDPFFQDMLRLHDNPDSHSKDGVEKEENNNKELMDLSGSEDVSVDSNSDSDEKNGMDTSDVDSASTCSKNVEDETQKLKDLEEESNKPLQDGGNINLVENPVTSLRNLVNRIPRIFGHLDMSTVLPTPKQLVALQRDQEEKKSNFYDIPVKRSDHQKFSSTLEQMLLNKDVPIENFATAMGAGHLHGHSVNNGGLLHSLITSKNSCAKNSHDSDKTEIVISDSEDEDELDLVNQPEKEDANMVAEEQETGVEKDEVVAEQPEAGLGKDEVVAEQQDEAVIEIEVEEDEDLVDVMTLDNDDNRNFLLGVQNQPEIILSESEESYNFQQDMEDGEVVEEESESRHLELSNEISIEATDVDSLLEQFEETASHLNLPPTPADSPENVILKDHEDFVITKPKQRVVHSLPKLNLMKSQMPTPPGTPTIALTATTLTSTLSVAQITKKITPVKRKSTILLEPLSMPAKKLRGQSSSCPNSRPPSQSNSRASSPNGRISTTCSVASEGDIPCSYQDLVLDHDYCQPFPKIEDKTDSGNEIQISSVAAQRYGNKFKIKKKSAKSITRKNSLLMDSKVCVPMQGMSPSDLGISEWDMPTPGAANSMEDEKPHVTVRYFDKIPDYYTHKLLVAQNNNDEKEKEKSPEKPFISIQEKSPLKRRHYRRRSSYSYSRSRSRSRSYSPYSSGSASSRYSRRRSRHKRYSYSDSSSPSRSRSRSRSWSPSYSRSRSRHHRHRSRSYSYSRSRSRSRSRSYSPYYRSSRSRGHRRHRHRRRGHHRRHHHYSRSRSRSPHWSRSRSRSRSPKSRSPRSRSPRSPPRYHSRSPIRRRLGEVPVAEDQKQQWEDRRVVYVGRIEEGTTRAYLRERFSRFGEIDKVSVHFRDYGDNYAFITFKYKCDAIACIDRGNAIPSEPKYDLCFGGRRHFCKNKYADLDAKNPAKEVPDTPLDFDALLKQAQSKIRKK